MGVGRRSLRRDRTGFGFMAQPGLIVQLSPNSTELLNSDCATFQTAETFLPSFPLQHQRPLRVFHSSREPKEFSPLSTAELDSNTHHPNRVTPRGG